MKAIGHSIACPISKTEQTRAPTKVFLAFIDEQRPNPMGGSDKPHDARRIGRVEYLVVYISQ